MKTLRDNAYHKYRKHKTVENLHCYKQLRNCYVRELRESKNRLVCGDIRSCQGDSKKLWRYLKQLIKPGGEAPLKICFEGANTDEETADLLNKFFVESVMEIHSNIPQPGNPIVGGSSVTEASFTEFQPITRSKLKEVVRSLKDCAGVDNITKRVLEDAFDVVADQFLWIINESLRNGVFPDAWKRSVVIPIPKVTKSTKPVDHRPINILPLYEKVLETIVKEQLMEYVDLSGILLDEQSGFRKQHSCETALNLLLLKWKQYVEKGNIVLAVFVDLKRAFETIDRDKLREMLHRYGIRGTALRWFSSYLENRTQVTKYNGAQSQSVTVNLGVPQGSVLGPLLFILYMNDVKWSLRNAEVNLFADDTVLFVVADNFEECYSEMNAELHNFSEWLKVKKLKLNVAKTKCMVVSTRRQSSPGGEIWIDEEVVEQVESMKYLGVIVDGNLNFNEHINYTIRKAARKFGVLCRISRYLTTEAKIAIYKSLIAPYSDYCASILFLATKQQLKRMQVLQSKVMRMILRCDRLTPRLNMLNCLQWMSVRQRIEYNTLVFVFRITKGMAPQYLTNTVIYGRDIHRYNTRRAGDIRLQKCKKACTQNSLFHKGYSLYNELPMAAKTTNNINEFKNICKAFVRQRALE